MPVWLSHLIDVLMHILKILFLCSIAWIYIVSAFTQIFEHWWKAKEAHYKRLEKGEGEPRKYAKDIQTLN